MSTQLAFLLTAVLMTFFICLTIIIYQNVEVKRDKKIKEAESSAEYWKGQYSIMKDIIQHAAKVYLTEEAINKLKEIR